MVWWPFATKPERADTLEVTDLHSVAPPLYSTLSFENLVGVEDYCHEIYVSYVNITILVVPAWTAGSQVDMDVSGRILRGWMPAIHAGMTEAADGQNAVKYWRFFMLCGRA